MQAGKGSPDHSLVVYMGGKVIYVPIYVCSCVVVFSAGMCGLG